LSAVEVLRAAAKVAKTPQESQMIDNSLMYAQEYAASLDRNADEKKLMDEQGKTGKGMIAHVVVNPPQLRHRAEFVAKGPHRFVVGVLKSVHCDNPALDLAVNSSGKL